MSERVLFIVTGLSGAGKSQVIKTLEDQGFYCVDNLPLALFPKFLELLEGAGGDVGPRFALGLDLREGHLDTHFPVVYEALRKSPLKVRILFVDVHAPPEVHFAFRDVASASEDKHKQELLGESEFRRTLSDARARAYRVEQEAESYGHRVKSLALGEAGAFADRARAFRETERITRLRLYLAAMEASLQGVPLVLPLADGIDIELWLRGEAPAEDAGSEKRPEIPEGADPSSKAAAPSPRREDPPWMQAIRH